MRRYIEEISGKKYYRMVQMTNLQTGSQFIYIPDDHRIITPTTIPLDVTHALGESLFGGRPVASCAEQKYEYTEDLRIKTTMQVYPGNEIAPHHTDYTDLSEAVTFAWEEINVLIEGDFAPLTGI